MRMTLNVEVIVTVGFAFFLTCSSVKRIIKELLVKQVADPRFELRASWEEGSTNYLGNEPN